MGECIWLLFILFLHQQKDRGIVGAELHCGSLALDGKGPSMIVRVPTAASTSLADSASLSDKLLPASASVSDSYRSKSWTILCGVDGVLHV